jgi:hypothetical protein
MFLEKVLNEMCLRCDERAKFILQFCNAAVIVLGDVP